MAAKEGEGGEGRGGDYRHLANATLIGGTSAQCLASLILWRSMPVRPASGFEKANSCKK